MTQTITVTSNCVITGKEYSVTVNARGFLAWQAGARIQDALPNVSPDDREFLISGISPEGWNETFSGDDE